MRRSSLSLGLVVSLLAGCNPSACGAFLSPPDEPSEVTFPSQVAAAPEGPLLAASATVDVTPEGSVYMAGFGFCKGSEGVHDPITVRALALRRGELTALIVGCDLIGLHAYQVDEVRARLADVVRPEAVLVAATHTHAGPDTLGMWGALPPFFSGLDDEVTEAVLGGIVRAAREAIAGLRPAVVRWGQAQAPEEGISENRRDPELIDRSVTAVAFDTPEGEPLATLVHFACHPESLGSDNELLSADFPAALYRSVEAGRPGATCVYLNGALGGMVTTDEEGHTFEEAERIGAALGALALGALEVEGATALPADLDLVVGRRPLLVPVQNRSYHLGHLFGIFGDRPFEGGHTTSEVTVLSLGPLVLLTAFGEALPRVGFELAELAAGAPGLVVGLGGDELGYLIHEEDWEAERYDYERSVSPGPLATTALREAARGLLEDVRRRRRGEE